MSEHTPTPWDIIAGDDYYITAEGYPKEFIGRFKSDDNGGYLAVVGNRPKDFGEANAAFIIKAVNSHEALVSALEDARSFMVEMRARHGDSGVGILIRAADTALSGVSGVSDMTKDHNTK